MREERWACPDDTGEPLARAFRRLPEALEFATHPRPQVEVNPAQRSVQRRLLEVTVVVDPATDVRIDPPRQIVKGRVGPVLETPLSDFPTHRL